MPVGAVTLRDATVADVAELAALEASLFGSDAWSEANVRGELEGEHRRYIVLVDEAGRIRGYAGLLVLGSDGDIQTIAVDPELRGAGYGRALMTELIGEAKKRLATQIFLEVRADNPVARGLYQSLEFQEIGVRKHYYQPDGVDAIIMQLQLKETA